MKLIALALTLALSTSAFASLPVTEAIRNIFPLTTYEGKTGSKKCLVTIDTKDNFAFVSIKTEVASEDFGLLDSSKGIMINETTGEISASQAMNSPYYVRGGKKFLNIRVNDQNQVAVSISTILFDHKGNDVSTFADCKVPL